MSGVIHMESIESEAREIYFQNYLHICGITVLFWDHILTLETEIRFLWKRRKFVSAYSFFTIRYFAVASNIPGVIFLVVSLPPNSFVVLNIKLDWLVCVIMILRMYALYGRSKRVLGALVVLGAICTGIAVWNAQGQHGTTITILPGCHPHFSTATSYHLAAAWGTLFVFDTVIFGMTLYNGWCARRRLSPRSAVSFQAIIVRDGALYFGVMVLANLANILTFLTNTAVLPGSLATFASCISITMMMRLMLNLHEHAERGELDIDLENLAIRSEPIFRVNVHRISYVEYGSPLVASSETTDSIASRKYGHCPHTRLPPPPCCASTRLLPIARVTEECITEDLLHPCCSSPPHPDSRAPPPQMRAPPHTRFTLTSALRDFSSHRDSPPDSYLRAATSVHDVSSTHIAPPSPANDFHPGGGRRKIKINEITGTHPDSEGHGTDVAGLRAARQAGEGLIGLEAESVRLPAARLDGYLLRLHTTPPDRACDRGAYDTGSLPPVLFLPLLIPTRTRAADESTAPRRTSISYRITTRLPTRTSARPRSIRRFLHADRSSFPREQSPPGRRKEKADST
ncbi:hypothetical protein K438DRAFT_2029120 [Mycena galopus ATCC 62051]|nr:hypothetical protein K438DRAFT_2029120 [Mycena galopus ATCC 62051]